MLLPLTFPSKTYPFIIDHITYDTIGAGDWSYNLAELMINNPQLFSDKKLLEELLYEYNSIDTNDSKTRLIATIFSQNAFYNNAFYIGIIGDSLTNIESKPLNAFLNVCSVEEAKILDIANVVGLCDTRISSCVNNAIKIALSDKSYYDYYRYNNQSNNKMKFSKSPAIFDDNGKVKDTIVHLQFMGFNLYENIDSAMLKHRHLSIMKDYSFDNYSCYHLIDKIEINNKKHPIDIQLLTLDDHIALIKVVCTDNIFDELFEMFKLKYGEYIYVYPIDHTFYNAVSGASNYVWSFFNNGIILVNNTEIHNVYYPSYTYSPPKLNYTNTVFNNITIIYCDKQMYRRLVQKETERKTFIENEQYVSDSLERVEKHRKDSIQKANEKERLKGYTSQI